MRSSSDNPPRIGTTIFAGILCWAIMTIGFVGLKILMQERPQFVGQPMTTTKAVLVQESPQIVVRKVTDDVAAIKPAQPESSTVHFEMRGRRDYRGLKTISDMSGQFRADHVLANDSDVPLFVLFRSPHPHSDNPGSPGLLASALRLQASEPGLQENVRDAWLWSGTIPARAKLTIGIRYEVGALRGVTYQVREQGEPVKQLRVTFQRQDLDAVRFRSGDGAEMKAGEAVVWERSDFLPPDHFSAELVEGRNLFTSLWQLVEIGPAISLLFLLAVLAAILARQPLTAVQVLTISAGYALYFPLLLYLSSRFSFAVALLGAVLVPGTLLVNYARWLLGARAGLVGGAVFLGLYQVFPTLAAFAGWNRGMVLLALGVVTLWVLIQLQNQALRRAPVTATATALLVFALLPLPVPAAEARVLVPLDLAEALRAKPTLPPPALVSYEPAQYQVQQDSTHLRVAVVVPFQVLRAGEAPVPLFAAPIHRSAEAVNVAEPGVARLVNLANRPSLLAEKPGSGSLQLSYRVPVENREGKKRAEIPLLTGPSGSVRLESARNDLEVLTGSLWSKTAGSDGMAYDIGVAGEEKLVLEWRDQGGVAPAAGTEQLYGIGVTGAQHLTVVHSDGSCTHFAEFEIPAALAQDFRMRLPTGVRLISASLNGTEIAAPVVENQSLNLRLPNRDSRQTAHRLSFRLAYPSQRLGFVGVAQLALPELFQTIGTLEWVLALPTGFQMEVVSSGLEAQNTPSDLARFGDYGRVLKAQPHTVLAKHLVPPGPMSLSLKYRQMVAGFFAASP